MSEGTNRRLSARHVAPAPRTSLLLNALLVKSLQQLSKHRATRPLYKFIKSFICFCSKRPCMYCCSDELSLLTVWRGERGSNMTLVNVLVSSWNGRATHSPCWAITTLTMPSTISCCRSDLPWSTCRATLPFHSPPITSIAMRLDLRKGHLHVRWQWRSRVVWLAHSRRGLECSECQCSHWSVTCSVRSGAWKCGAKINLGFKC